MKRILGAREMKLITGRLPRWRWALLALVPLCLSAATPHSVKSHQVRRLAVTAFCADDSLSWSTAAALAAGLTERSAASWQVISQQQVRAVMNAAGLPANRPMNGREIREIGRLLRLAYLIDVRAIRRRGEFELSAEVVRPDSADVRTAGPVRDASRSRAVSSLMDAAALVADAGAAGRRSNVRGLWDTPTWCSNK